ncbi:MAG: hypothetical protein IPK08_12940 [Bacteroidetes bacterium]|nr:hypothetical protein [Bacteroidota bacterium]
MIDAIDSGIAFASIEKEVSVLSYRQRATNVEDKSNGEIERLKKIIAELWREVAVIDSYGVSEIFEKTPIDEYLADFTDSNLIRYLLVNGILMRIIMIIYLSSRNQPDPARLYI